MNRYFGAPRWRYLALPLVIPSILPLMLITLFSIGTIRGMRMWEVALHWSIYETYCE